jgi:DNA polymerase-3 subunit epsilon
MAEHWTDGRMVGFDLETTSPDPEEARIVTAAIVEVGGGEPTVKRTWLVDPGVEIPEQAAAIHGVTTERARAEGADAKRALREIEAVLTEGIAEGYPLVVFNARYDLTVLDREIRRQIAVPSVHVWDHLGLRVIDPLVLDKWLDRYRRGSRKLGDMCAYYGIGLTDAHDATADALAAARLAWWIGKRGRVIRSWPEEGNPAALWEHARQDLDRLHQLQVELALEQRTSFAAYKRSKGDVEEAERIESEVGWPVLELRPEGVHA